MLAPTWLLFALGVLGATDIRLYHDQAHRLHQHPPARGELITHFLRGPTYALLFLLVPNFTFHGAALTALLCLLAFDLAISLADFWLEPASRRALGGLPRGEYVLHVLLAMTFGALVAAVVYEAGAALGEPTAMHWQAQGTPEWLRAALAVMAGGVLASGIADLRAARRLGQRA